MPGMEFEYDEKGGTFYYFLLSFFALILFPITYYLWPRGEKQEDPEKERKACQCIPCKKKNEKLKSQEPWKGLKRCLIKIGILLAWVAFVYVAYKASQVEIDYSEFDPYFELGVDRGASDKEIKKAYRSLSRIHHPDKGGDPLKFLKISKAHQALTDPESKENWEKYGNPDGPGATQFGIALPKWIVEKDNSIWVLAVYGLVFIVILPIVVGTWWYRSIKYSAEQVLMDTTQLYYYFFHKTPTMQLKRAIMILSASMEFEKNHNHEIVNRPSDDEEMRLLLRELPNLNEKNKERPLCYSYSIKARALVHAHLSRLDLPPNTLDLDRQYVTKKCPYLINEMVSIVAQLVSLKHAGRTQHMPQLETIEHCMKLSQMMIQALWDSKSPLLQLPHISEDMLRYFVAKKRNVRNIHQLAALKDEERRQALRGLSDLEYRNVMNVLATMPYITMDVHTEVLDDEDPTITAGSIVTVTVKLKRQNMEELFDMSLIEVEERLPEEKHISNSASVEEKDDEEEDQTSNSPVRNKPKVWEKNKKKPKSKAGAKNKKKKAKKPAKASSAAGVTGDEATDSTHANGVTKKSKKDEDRSDGETDDEHSEPENESEDETGHENEKEDDDEEDWMKFQEETKKENALETKSKETHAVHCPYFAAVKYEWWWLYVCDRRSHTLISAPLMVTSLKTEEEFKLKFSAPRKPGQFQYTVCLRSDSYLDFDQQHNIKLDVKEAKKIESHPQWDISDDEEKEEDEDATETEESSEEESSDEE